MGLNLDAGTYYVSARDNGDNHAGTYELSATLGPEDVSDDFNTSGGLPTNGTSIIGDIEVAGDIDWFELTIPELSTVEINLRGLSLNNTRLAVIDSEGNLVRSDNNSGDGFDDFLNFVIEAGTYYISVEDSAGFHTGTYELTASVSTEILDDFSADINTTGATGFFNFTRGELEVVGDDDWFEFTVTEDSTVYLHLNRGTLNNPFLYLYDSEGTLLGSDNNSGDGLNAQLIQFLEAGTYYASARANNDAGTGSYFVGAVDNADDFSQDINTTGVLTADGPATTGRIDFNQELANSQDRRDIDWFALEVIAGQAYEVDYTALGSGIAEGGLDLGLYDSSGEFIGNANGFTAQTTGTVFVSATSIRNGNYSLTATTIEDDFVANINTTGVLIADGSTVTGNIDFANDQDWFALEVIEGEIYEVRFRSEGVPGGGNLTLYDSSGRLEQFGSTILAFTAQTTGTVFVEADVILDGIGEYSLTATLLTVEDDFTDDINTTGVLIADGASVTGNIDFAGDEDWFALEVVAGESYLVEFFSEDLTGVPDLQLRSSSGGFVKDGARTLTFTAETTGTVFIEADIGSQQTGEYNLTTIVTRTGDDFTADINTTGVLIANGVPVTGKLEVAGDNDWFALTIADNQILQIDLSGVGLIDPFLQLYDDAGNLVAQNDNGGFCLLYTSPSPRDRG